MARVLPRSRRDWRYHHMFLVVQAKNVYTVVDASLPSGPCLTGWLPNRLPGWLTGWLTGWLAGSLACWLAGCLAAWLPGCLAALAAWLPWLPGCLGCLAALAAWLPGLPWLPWLPGLAGRPRSRCCRSPPAASAACTFRRRFPGEVPQAGHHRYSPGGDVVMAGGGTATNSQIASTAGPLSDKCLRPISLLRLSLLRCDSNFPANSLLTWEFHPLKSRLWLSQTLWNPES